jgi:DNA-binding MarR family transcriptional regulator
MGEVEQDGTQSQRQLSSRLNLSLGLVNTFLKRLIKKGYFKVHTLPRNRVKYLLTPKGLARKSRLTVDYLRYSVSFYRDIKTLLMSKYLEMERSQVRSILFFGIGEVAELAYLYLQSTGIRLVGVVDETRFGEGFFQFRVEGLERLGRDDFDVVFVTDLDDSERAQERLIERGVSPERIVFL